MKKTLLALAVLGAFAGAASAQSSVTLYGIVDLGLQRVDPKAANAASTTAVVSGHQSGSRLGFRGTEDLGGGLKAIFTLENGFTADNGATAQSDTTTTPVTTRLFGRQAWAGLSGNFGTVALGRFATFSSGTGSFDMFGFVDPFVTGFGRAALSQTFSSANALRLDNSVLYQSPVVAGLQAGVGYSLKGISNACPGSTAATTQECAGPGNNNGVIFSGLSYGIGPVRVAVTYDVGHPTDAQEAQGLQQNQKHLQVGGTYDLKVVKLHAAYAKEDNQVALSTVSTTNGADATAWMAGVTVPVGPVNILASYQNRNGDEVIVAGTPVEADKSVWSLGATYPFSKRTNAYFSYADSNGKKSLNNNLTQDAKEISLGLRHAF